MISDDEYRYFASDQKVAIVAADETPVTLTTGGGNEVHVSLDDVLHPMFDGMDVSVISFNINEIDSQMEGEDG